MSDPIHDRGQSMENLFFKRQDQELLARIRAKHEADEERQHLSQVSGVEDRAVIDALIGVGVTAESLTSISLIPLIAIAWADNRMEYAEKQAILKASLLTGIDEDTPSYELLVSWLDHKPSDELLDAWRAYISAIKASASPQVMTQLKNSILGRAEEVALSAGGFLHMTNRISPSEQKVLDELTAAF